MAISVNKIYQTVLALANKEQRGYITPQEFNLFADHAQMDIFEQYFYDLNQFKRIVGNDTMHSDMINVLEEKISAFHKEISYAHYDQNERYIGTKDSFLEAFYNKPADMYRLIEILKIDPNQGIVSEIDRLNVRDYERAIKSTLTRGSVNMPVCVIKDDSIVVAPSAESSTSQIKIDYIKKPSPPKWTYIVVNEKPLYNSSAPDHHNFELHDSEQKDLVIKILQLAGVSIKDYNITQVAAQEEVKTIQQQKS
tara:strand:+ start:272 stop:1027 length:756 start_codon:yes stop_codon:yes gene_type:complete